MINVYRHGVSFFHGNMHCRYLISEKMMDNCIYQTTLMISQDSRQYLCKLT